MAIVDIRPMDYLDEKPALVLKGERSQILDLKLHGQTPLILIAFSVRNTIKGSKL